MAVGAKIFFNAPLSRLQTGHPEHAEAFFNNTLCYAHAEKSVAQSSVAIRILQFSGRVFLQDFLLFLKILGFFETKFVQLAGKPFGGLTIDQSTCAAHRMDAPCYPRRTYAALNSLD